MFMLTSALLLAPLAAHADSEDEDDGSSYLEESDADKGKKKKKPAKNMDADGQVREITRGVYAKANVGAGLYLGRFASTVNTGTVVGLSVGQDFVDKENQSMAWELGLVQGLHNGVFWESQADAGCGVGAPCTEGDLRTYGVQALYEFSAYPTRRVGIGFRAGGGVLYSPLLIERNAYGEEVLPRYGLDPGLHESFKPYVLVGPTLEYYTKLSHFSVGLDVDVFYGFGWDLGLNAAATLKYTF
jgi:hypothetical protein